jgi:hypothetical protein
MNKQEFLDYVKQSCNDNGIIFKVSDSSVITTEAIGSECSGFFEESPMIPATLGIAGGLNEKQFYEVLAHEFSHSQQWLDKSPYWIESRLNKEEVLKFSKQLGKDVSGLETGDLVQMWIDKELEIEEDVLNNLVNRTTAVEFDCESRTLKLIEKLQLDIDFKTYAQKSNAYLLTYFYAQRLRKWTKAGKATYSIPEVYSKMPTFIHKEFCKNITDDLVKLINDNCF